ncbi:hypothetical protein D1BOALGB6SA_9594 [Olavius sp. associated proteobacterium Delta 1]|nr:hypothetical protein D1BOALGB6SA_9594 [Olavius sp. associated proteobacterium Delta 1]
MNPSIDPKIDIDRVLNRALYFHNSGQLEQAEASYCRILEIAPQQADALHLLGLIHGEKGSLETAKKLIDRAIQNDANVPVFYVSFGDILQREEKFTEAVNYYRKALSLNPNLVEGLCNMGNALRQLAQYNQAIACYRKSLVCNPRLPEAYNNMGLAYSQQDQYDSAETCFKTAIALSPDYAQAYNNLGNVYRDKFDYQAAMEQYHQALSLAPESSMINYNLGILFQIRNEADKAVLYYQKAVEGQSPIPDAHNNLGKYYQDRNQPERSISHFVKAIDLDPEHFDAHFNRSLSLLATARFEEGWNEYEWRFKRDDWKRVYPHRLKSPRWDGREFTGKTLFIHSEQGFGDTIWFVRYLPQVKSRGGSIIFESRPELIDLLQDNIGVDQLASMSFDHPPQISHDLHIPLMSLPAVLATTIETIPAQVPYLYASEAKFQNWAARINGSGFKIGLVWAAKSTNKHERSCALENFLPLLTIKNIQIYGLQKGEDAQTVNQMPVDVHNLGQEFETFADTAGAVECLDLVISVDTAVAHLAGAMGKPVWVLLPFAADWKWLLERRDSPWYPTMRLFRQPQPGDWKRVVLSLVEELKQYIEAEHS